MNNEVRFRDSECKELPAMPPNAQPNPDWVEPADGEVVEIWMTSEGAKKAVWNAKTKQIEWSPYTFEECYGPISVDKKD